MRKNKGFTLIELLAVIVILAVVAVTAVPLITGVIDQVKKAAYEESLRNILNATNLYIATNEFSEFPSDGINISELDIQIKNNDFTSGKIIKNEQGELELDKISDGSYCGSGSINDITVIKGSCDSLDQTPPSISITYNLITSNSITIVADGEDLESGINSYQFSKDNGVTWSNKQTSNVYDFTGLETNTSYNFKVKVHNNNLLSTISDTLTVSTINVSVPTYSVDTTDWSQNKIVTIYYPERETGYVYQYSLDGGINWEEVASPNVTKSITFTENGTVIAKIVSGMNEVVGANYTVTNIDTTVPNVQFSMNGNSDYAQDRATTVTVSDTDSGVSLSQLKYLWNTSTVEPSESSFMQSFTNEHAITSPTGVTGSYYLWILAKDKAGNSNIVRTNIFNLDNTKPVITLTGNSIVNVSYGASYTDSGATASDNVDGNITSNITMSGSVNTSVVGSYTLTYNVSDAAGNNAITKTRTVNVLDPNYVISEGVNKPVLATGMTAKKWDGSNWVTVNNPDTDTSWYDYSNKQWANAQTADGSMWVWIPRYIYKISSGWHTNVAGTIDVQFSMGTDDTLGGTVTLDTGTTANASNNKWTNHPAFTFGTTELTGMWVAKFQASGTTSSINVKPSVASLRSITIGTMFTASRNMETNSKYGWGTTGSGIDTHMMKNTEWGMVVYLAQSVYGKNSEVWINPSNTYITGCAGTSAIADDSSGCSYYYYTPNGQQASTTGTIYGIYDMAGTAFEYVAAYVNNAEPDLRTFGSSIINANAKYKDVYSVSSAPQPYTSVSQVDNYNRAIEKKGDAVYEISNSDDSNSGAWYGDRSMMPYGEVPFFQRGGLYQYDSMGGIFTFMMSNLGGDGWEYLSFRPVLAVGSGL